MANETSGRRDNRVPFRASTKTPNIMMLRRTRLLLIVCGILAFAVLGIKLFSVMIIHHDEYEKMAIDQQVRETEITASRGAIYDTNGKILAMNASVDTIFISPAEIAKNNEDPQLIARELSEILDVDYDKILSMTKNTDRWYEVVKRKVEPDVSEKVRAFKKEKKLVGVKIEPDTKRYYPYGAWPRTSSASSGRTTRDATVSSSAMTAILPAAPAASSAQRTTAARICSLSTTRITTTRRRATT